MLKKNPETIENEKGTEKSKSIFEKIKAIFNTKDKKKERIKKFNYTIKRTKIENKKEKIRNLRSNYLINVDEQCQKHDKQKQKLKIYKTKKLYIFCMKLFTEKSKVRILALLCTYILCIGAIVSIPIVMNHLEIGNQNQMKQERFK